MLRDEDRNEIRTRLSVLEKPVFLDFFTQKLAGACQMCHETERLLKEVAALSTQINLQIHNFITDKDIVSSSGIDKIPATVIRDGHEGRIRFYGIPSGYEFSAFLEAITMVSKGDSNLSPESRQKIGTVNKPVLIQVFTTPTCPYCPKAALTAMQIALQHEQIRADIIEISEFPYLVQKYAVMGVPKIVINEKHGFEGALPEIVFIEHILNATGE
jgi:glutaredoxin-like protein